MSRLLSGLHSDTALEPIVLKWRSDPFLRTGIKPYSSSSTYSIMKLAGVFQSRSLLFLGLTFIRVVGGVFILLLVAAEMVSLVKCVVILPIKSGVLSR